MAKDSDIARMEELISEATGASVLADDTKPAVSSSPLFSIRHLARAGLLLPPWWSKRRDAALSVFWKKGGHLSSAVYNSQAKLVGIPLRIVALDQTNPEHRYEADLLTQVLNAESDFNRSWPVIYAKFIEDLLTQDNGAFMEVIGEGEPDGPIVGTGMGLRHLDSYRCIRTSNPIYPVLYEAEDNKKYKMHWTRIITMSQMPSSRVEMNGVGFCAVSRAVDIAQNLIDISIYKQERLGSRPPGMIMVGKGITGQQIMEAFYAGEQETDNRGQERFSRTVALGSENTDIGLERIDLTHMDPFDEETSINLGMFAIALAFGMDAGELWPTQRGSSNQVDANLRKLRSRGKLPAQTTTELSIQMNQKLLPPHLMAIFDLPDDEENQQKALIRDIRARNRDRDLGSGTITIRAARQMGLDDGDISQQAFNYMELEDGRLPDGRPLSLTFFSSDPVYSRHLNFGSTNPLALTDNDPTEVTNMIEGKQSGVLQELAETTSSSKEERLMIAYGALEWLRAQYQGLLYTANYSIAGSGPEGGQDQNVDQPNQGPEEAPQDQAKPESLPNQYVGINPDQSKNGQSSRDGRDDG